jgi:hypothetical protein
MDFFFVEATESKSVQFKPTYVAPALDLHFSGLLGTICLFLIHSALPYCHLTDPTGLQLHNLDH